MHKQGLQSNIEYITEMYKHYLHYGHCIYKVKNTIFHNTKLSSNLGKEVERTLMNFLLYWYSIYWLARSEEIIHSQGMKVWMNRHQIKEFGFSFWLIITLDSDDIIDCEVWTNIGFFTATPCSTLPGDAWSSSSSPGYHCTTRSSVNWSITYFFGILKIDYVILGATRRANITHSLLGIKDLAPTSFPDPKLVINPGVY